MNGFLLRLLGLATAAAGVLSWADLRGHSSAVLLWGPKLLASALAPWLALLGAVTVALGLRRRDPLVLGAGLAGAALHSQL